MSAQRVLIDTARATVYGLRALADSLELALDRLDSEVSEPQPAVSDPAGSAWAVVSEQAPLTPPSTPARGSTGSPFTCSHQLLHQQLPATTKWLRSFPTISALLSALVWPWVLSLLFNVGLNVPGKLDFGQRQHCSPKLDLKPEVYLIVRAPGLDHPVRVSTAAEYFRIIPSFRNSNSISHSFPSIAEARVYCAAIGIAFPDQQ